LSLPRIPAALLILLVTLAGCGGPLGPFSGGQLSGEVQNAATTDWAFSDTHETVQLEVQPTDPHSVNTWCAASEGQLYVPTSMILGPTNPEERDWVGFVKSDPAVRIRIVGKVYERVATRVTDDAEFEKARLALEAKYEIAPEDRDPERTIWIYRLDPRPS